MSEIGSIDPWGRPCDRGGHVIGSDANKAWQANLDRQNEGMRAKGLSYLSVVRSAIAFWWIPSTAILVISGFQPAVFGAISFWFLLGSWAYWKGFNE